MHLESRTSIDVPIAKLRRSTNKHLQEFKTDFAVTHIVAISGGADGVNEAIAKGIIRGICSELILNDAPVAILSGGTRGGIPEMVLRVAKEYELPTLAVFPRKARIDRNVLAELIDLPIEGVPPSLGDPTFGTETPTFAQIPDIAVVIGGGFGTLIEVACMMKQNQARFRKGKPPIYIIPILNTTGTADLIPNLTTLDNKMSQAIVSGIQDGISAGRAIVGLVDGKTLEQIMRERRFYSPRNVCIGFMPLIPNQF